MVTQTSSQNQGSFQPLSDFISLHLIVRCPSGSSWAAIFKLPVDTMLINHMEGKC